MMIRLKSLEVFLMFLCVGIISGFGLISDIRADEDFSKRYQTYQQAVSSAKASFNNKDYQVAIAQYTKAIEMSPFVASHYYDRGIAWYRKGDDKKAIEDFDARIVGPVLKGLEKFGEFSVMVLPDHPTPIAIKTHTRDAVPFVLYRNGQNGNSVKYCEKNAKATGLVADDCKALAEELYGKTEKALA